MRTTIQIDDQMRKELKILASKRDISYQKLLEEMVEVFKELDSDKTIISIPSGVAKKVKDKLTETDFKSLSEFNTFVLRMTLTENPKGDISGNEKKIKEKLKRLGYIE